MRLIYEVVDMLFTVIELLIFVRVIFSWTNITPYSSKIAKFVYDMTNPLVHLVSNLLEKLGLGGRFISFWPIVIFLIMEIIRNILVRC